MDEFERRLTESLRARAEDVEPTPALWDEVRGRFGRRRWLIWTSSIAAAAAAVLLAFVVVPGVWDALRGPDRLDILDEPAIVPGGSAETLLAATDGERILLHGIPASDGQPAEIGHVEAGERIETVAIRPGSTPPDITVVYVVRDAEDAYRIRVARQTYEEDAVRTSSAPLPEGVQPVDGSDADASPVPIWSPDGAHLAWVETIAGMGPQLRTVTWALGEPLVVPEQDPDTPGAVGVPEPQAAAAHTLTGPELPPGELRLDAWSWTTMARSEATGSLAVSGGFAAIEIPIERHADGELALGVPVRAERGGATLLAVADGGPDLARFQVIEGEGPIGPVYELLLHEDERDTPLVILREQRWPDQTDDVELTDTVWEAVGTDPSAAWLRAAGDRVLLGTVDGVWLLEGVASPTALAPELLDGVVHADVHLVAAEPSPPAEDSPEPTPDEVAYPDFALLATDGSAIFVIPPHRAHDGDAREPLWTVPGGQEVRALAVRPGSTPEELDAAVWIATDGGHELHHLRRVGGGAGVEPFPEPYQVSGDAAPGSRPRPVWSPDGAYLAWAELPADETAGAPRLRTIGWDDGPGAGDPATDNAAFELDDIPLTPVRAEVWTGSVGGDECPPADALTMRLTSQQLEAWRVRMEVQADGALRMAPDATTLLLDDPFGTPVAFALDERVCDGMFAPYALYADDSDDDGEVRLSVFDPIGHQGFPVPDEVASAELPGFEVPAERAVWITGLGNAVIVGVDGQGWVTGRPLSEFEERPLRIGGTVIHAEPIG